MAEHRQIRLDITVHDRRVLFRAAMKRAVANGMKLTDWLALRRENGDRLSADLQILLDPGAEPTGCSIDHCHAVKFRYVSPPPLYNHERRAS